MKTIKFPFQLDSFGRAITTDSTDEIYRQRVYTLVSTVVMNRPMMPTYGVDVARAVYENGGDAEYAVPAAIARAISTNIPLVQVRSIDIVGPNETGDMSVDILLELPSGVSSTVSVPYYALSNDGVSVGDIV